MFGGTVLYRRNSACRDVVLSADQDPFFNTHMYSSFGELGVAVKTIMEEYQGERKMHDNISSIEDMQRFVENFPELRKKSHTVGKHVALMTQLVQKVDSSGALPCAAVSLVPPCAAVSLVSPCVAVSCRPVLPSRVALCCRVVSPCDAGSLSPGGGGVCLVYTPCSPNERLACVPDAMRPRTTTPAKMDVSALEQDIVCGGAQASSHYARISELLDNASVRT